MHACRCTIKNIVINMKNRMQAQSPRRKKEKFSSCVISNLIREGATIIVAKIPIDFLISLIGYLCKFAHVLVNIQDICWVYNSATGCILVSLAGWVFILCFLVERFLKLIIYYLFTYFNCSIRRRYFLLKKNL